EAARAVDEDLDQRGGRGQALAGPPVGALRFDHGQGAQRAAADRDLTGLLRALLLRGGGLRRGGGADQGAGDAQRQTRAANIHPQSLPIPVVIPRTGPWRGIREKRRESANPARAAWVGRGPDP